MWMDTSGVITLKVLVKKQRVVADWNVRLMPRKMVKVDVVNTTQLKCMSQLMKLWYYASERMWYNGWQYGKWLITGYKPIKLRNRLSEAHRFKYHEYSHLLYCVLCNRLLLLNY